MLDLSLKRPQLMGVLNTTPDSFSDGGRFNQLDLALRRVEAMLAESVDIIDIGGESTRPGASEVAVQEELDRVIPVLEGIRARFAVPVSVDTSKAAVMQAAIAAGAEMINDVRALQEPDTLAVCAEATVKVCLMHMQGRPRTMQANPHYENVLNDVQAFLQGRVVACEQAGIAAERLVLDPGFGFGKKLNHNLALLRQLNKLTVMGLPLLVGMSRKSMISQILGERSVDERLYGSLALAAIAAMQGASIIRVHDVAASADVLKIIQAVQNS